MYRSPLFPVLTLHRRIFGAPIFCLVDWWLTKEQVVRCVGWVYQAGVFGMHGLIAWTALAMCIDY